jgi:transposase
VFGHANRRLHTTYVTGVVDLDRARLLDVAQGRPGRVLGDWLDTRPADWRDRILVAAIDPFRGYANALASRLPDATLVVGRFQRFDTYHLRPLLHSGFARRPRHVARPLRCSRPGCHL